ncbi:MAG TPA: aminotransferase class III-fold pyridoxal phosphate-dependent enzyme [Thermoanaerobaculia bacterium]|nr:aminotransferase class III-fold pyridoxal phosphate-dependent enzyme [Thermoanaerobaculia bacterium]
MGRLVRGNLPPRIAVVPPGGRSRELSRRLAAVEAPGINTLAPGDGAVVVWDEALGANVLDVDGNVYVDLTAGFGAAAVGHRHPRVVAAVVEQAGRLVHGLGDVAAHPLRVELAERLAAMAPVDAARVHFAVSGADAIEIAVKTAVAATGRARIVAFDPSYHGVTLGALALSSRPEFRAPATAHLHSHVVRLPYACALESAEAALAAGDVAAVVVEPVVGREGVLVPPEGWLAGLAASARRHGALLVADEILTGFGRTGRMFAVERDRVRPDLLCCGKGLGGGMPIAAVIGERRHMEVWRTDGEALHTGTFVAHPLAVAGALAALEVFSGERLVDRAVAIGARLGRLLAPLAAAGGAVVEVRGIGALWGIEVVDAASARRVVAHCRAEGVLVLAGGPDGRVIELSPPLTISDAQIDAALGVLAGAVAAEVPAYRG